YVHRIGRTGRAGRAGASFTIASSADSKSVAAIEKLIGRKIEWKDAPAKAAEESAPREAEHGARRRGRDAKRSRPSERADSRRERNDSPPRPEREARGPQRQPAKPSSDAVPSHLPAFLLRPVPVKAG